MSDMWPTPKCQPWVLPGAITCSKYLTLGQGPDRSTASYCGFVLSTFSTFLFISYFGILYAILCIWLHGSSKESMQVLVQDKTRLGVGGVVSFICFPSYLFPEQGSKYTKEVCRNPTTLLSLPHVASRQTGGGPCEVSVGKHLSLKLSQWQGGVASMAIWQTVTISK
jgi:hypothetical protein